MARLGSQHVDTGTSLGGGEHHVATGRFEGGPEWRAGPHPRGGSLFRACIWGSLLRRGHSSYNTSRSQCTNRHAPS